MKIASSGIKRKARIEIIPLIDIMFFLLATFVMVSISMVQNKGIQVKLPIANTGSPQDHSKQEVIAITESGEIFLNKLPISVESLATEMSQLARNAPDSVIFIHGDRETQFGSVLTVMDTVRTAGIQKVTFETNPTKIENE